MEYIIVVPARPRLSTPKMPLAESWDVIKFEDGKPTVISKGVREHEDAWEAAKRAGKNLRRYFDCIVCANTCHDDFMVHHHIWREAKFGRGRVHLACLEEFLGRELTRDDFTDVPINNAIFFGFTMARRPPPQSIEAADCRKIVAALIHALGPNHWNEEWAKKAYDDRYRTEDGWDVLIGGWHHPPGWSRGYMISDHRGQGTMQKHRGHVSPKHDEGRYGGLGWRDRMVEDIVADIKKLREAA